ncbi:MAG: chromosome segregation protein SMC, partial [Pseudomonadota bacterium]
MRFTRIRLNGFKSFVDPTEMVIADGLTGVVGPNGCGKSNLLEALRWVMGENRPTAMRGDGMEDVIFAGTASRPARNFAEVSIAIDNSERLAPQGFNESEILDVARRITRDAGSAYKVNSRDVRARDVQMLFADASTGAHSPALVRQGQISELINARPKARRRILEEAAGISGLYQRRHEAEMKLRGAETNLARVDDVIEQLAAQLAQLARQARQARRYRELSEALRAAEGQLLYRRWREANDALMAADTRLQRCVTEASEAERAARAAATVRAKADEALPPLREEATVAAAILQRLAVESDGITGDERRAQAAIEALEGRIAQQGADLEREDALNRDAVDTIARLDAEIERLQAEANGHEELLQAAAHEARDAAAVLQDRETALAQLTEDVARLSARHHAAQRLRDDTRRMLGRSVGEADAADAAANSAKDAAETAAAAVERANEALDAHRGGAEAAEERLAAADTARADAQAREADARASRSEAEGEVSALTAEVNALARLVERDTAEGGQILDLLTVSPGLEKALGAALADDLRAPAITNGAATGWVALPPYGTAQPLPSGATPLATSIEAPDVLGRRLAQVGLVARDDGARLQPDLRPGQRLVSEEGDLWRWDGFRASAEDAPSAAALRLQQLNRLQELKQDLVEARARADGAARAHEHLKAELAQVTADDTAAREARRAADVAFTEATRAVSRAEADCNIAESKLESLRLASARHHDAARDAKAELAEAEAALSDLEDLDAARAAAEDVKLTVEAARLTMIARRTEHDDIRRTGEARRARLDEAEDELATWRTRLETADARVAELTARRAGHEADLEKARRKPAELAGAREKLARSMEEAEVRRSAADDTLAAADTAHRQAVADERSAERAASEAREARARAEAESDAARLAVEAAAARITEDLDTTAEALLEKLGCDPDAMPSASALETEVNRCKRQRDALGSVNLRAEEDAQSVQAEHDALVAEKADLEEAIRALRSGIASLNREGRERLLTAFEEVNTNFATLFKNLFGGGEAKLVMVESDDPLDAGLEIMCQPPGKKLATLSLLSGGEQTLTALALIFAVFLANPAPICVLDEVDAPLDDANVTRFCDLLDEMTHRTETRFLIITHHAVTMARMDRLFGVTMAEQGVSQLVSVDLNKAEQLV